MNNKKMSFYVEITLGNGNLHKMNIKHLHGQLQKNLQTGAAVKSATHLSFKDSDTLVLYVRLFAGHQS